MIPLHLSVSAFAVAGYCGRTTSTCVWGSDSLLARRLSLLRRAMRSSRHTRMTNTFQATSSLGRQGEDAFHALFGADVDGENVRVVTAYYPSPEEWEEDLKTRRHR